MDLKIKVIENVAMVNDGVTFTDRKFSIFNALVMLYGIMKGEKRNDNLMDKEKKRAFMAIRSFSL